MSSSDTQVYLTCISATIEVEVDGLSGIQRSVESRHIHHNGLKQLVVASSAMTEVDKEYDQWDDDTHCPFEEGPQ